MSPRRSSFQTPAQRRFWFRLVADRCVAEALEPRQLLAAPPGYAFNVMNSPSIGGTANFQTGDFNNDGKLDLLVSSYTSYISKAQFGVALGNGDGTFRAPQNPFEYGPIGSSSSGAYGSASAVGDFNRDGKLDVVIATKDNTNAIYFAYGNGDGTLQAPTAATGLGIPPGFGMTVYRIAVGDFNRDGSTDIVLSGSTNRLVFFNGTANNGSWNVNVLSLPSSGAYLLPDDFDQDGYTDLGVVLAHDVVIYSRLNQATPQYNYIQNVSDKDLSGFTSGKLLGPSSAPSIVLTYASQTSPGVWASSLVILPRPMVNGTTVTYGASGPIYSSVAVGDFNGDGFGDVDLHRISFDPTEYFLTGNGDGTVNFGQSMPRGGGQVMKVQALDLNGDGWQDLVEVDFTGTIQSYLNVPPSLTVTTATDEDNGTASPAAGTGTSLREAIAYAQFLGGSRTITIAPALGNANAVLNLASTGVTISGSANITIRSDTGRVSIRGDGSAPFASLGSGAALTIQNLTVTNFRNAIVNAGGTVTIQNSTFTGNSATSGSATVSGTGTFALRNSTFAGNTGDAALAITGGSAALDYVTVAGNAAGGARLLGGALTIRNGILANNGSGSDLAVTGGTLSGSNNVVRTGTTTGLSGTISADPLLNPLTNNGGQTDTMSLQFTSPAIDAGVAISGVTVDQRGVARAQLVAPDIGAFEARLSELNAPTVTTPDGAVWFLVGSTGFDQRIYRQAPGQTPVWVDFGAATALGLQKDGSVLARNSAGIFTRVGSATGTGTGWAQRGTVTAGDGALWFLGTDGAGGNKEIYRSGSDGSFASAGAAGVRLVVISGTIGELNASGAFHRRQGSNGGNGFNWVQQSAVVTSDNAIWFIYTDVTGGTGGAIRVASDGSFTDTGGAASQLGVLDGGTVVARNDGGGVAARPGSAGGVGTAWIGLGTRAAADGAAWFVGSELNASGESAIYRWAYGQPLQSAGGLATRLALAIDKSIVVQNAAGDVFGRIGSLDGVGTAWQQLGRATAADGATWFIVGGSVIYRWPAGADAQALDGSADQVYAVNGGQILVRNSANQFYLRFGSQSGVGTSWQLLATSLVVNTLADESDPMSSPLLGTGTSLREALAYANALGTAATITFDPSLAGQTVTLLQGWTNSADSSALTVSGNVTIQGPTAGAGVTIAVASGVQKRIAFVDSTGALTVRNLTLTGGYAGDFGGAIWSFGSLTVDGSTFTGNSAGEGGAIQSWSGSAALTIRNSTFAGNSATSGSAIATGATTNAYDHVTIVDNTAGTSGGSLLIYQTSVTLRDSVVARNTNDGALFNGDGSGTFSAVSTSNLLGPGSWKGLSAASNTLGVDAATLRLGTLADNGGPTRTVMPLPGSPAINGGMAIGGITADQRGTTRPQGYAVDIGAVERVATAATVSSASFELQSRLAVTFGFTGDASATFSRSNITLTNLGTAQAIAAGALSWNDAGTSASLVLSNLLPEGNYRASAGGQSVDFFVLAGDFNRDRTVNFDDLLVLAKNYGGDGKTNAQGDVSYDGLVTFSDLLALARNYGKTLPAFAALATQSSASVRMQARTEAAPPARRRPSDSVAGSVLD